MQVFVWDNSSGRYSDPAAAFGAWLGGTLGFAGFSTAFTVNNIGGNVHNAPYLTGLESFAIYVMPEPGSAALLAIGAGALLARRRFMS